jgi:uncharacterized protein (DUF433 family)
MEDPRLKPAYTIAEAARLLRAHPHNLSYWFPRSRRGDKEHGYLNFLEIFQGYIIQVLRSEHKMSMQKIGRTIRYLKRTTGQEYPLATVGVKTDGAHLFLENLDHLICASQEGQEAMKVILDKFLKRVEYSSDGLAQRFFPLTRDFRPDGPKFIVIDPRINFGRPCLYGRGISTAIIAKRFKSGEDPKDLADDYNCNEDLIKEAIRAELEPPTLAA